MPRQDSLAERSHTSLSQGDHVTCDNGEFEELEHTTGDTEEPLSLKQKVASQLEHYLSEGHLAQDGFLLKHVQRNKLRYVSLKLLTSFSKIRELTRDWHVTAAATHASPLLQLNAEGTKVRRVEPPPAWLLAAPTSRLLLAWNLPSLQARGVPQEPPEPQEPPGLLETVLRVFGVYGDVTSVRVLHPGKAVPLDLRPHARTHRELGRSLCAVVEFHSLEGSRRAHRALAEEEEEGAPRCGGAGGLHVVSLGSQGRSAMDSNPERAPDGIPTTGSPAPQPLKARPGEERRNPEPSPRGGPDSGSKHPLRRPNPRFPGQSPRGPAQRPKAPPLGDRNPVQQPPGSSGDTGAPAVVPWVQRRKVAAGDAHGGKGGKKAAPQRTLRPPAGPDGTAGFLRGGRGRGRPPQAGSFGRRLLPGLPPPTDQLEWKNTAGT
ncbi:unnamed protein product [Boreogadus saida]